MLRSFQIKNYVLIDSLDISFPAGLNIITGQTGAGKSIMLGALSLVTGGKADVSQIGGHGDTCAVEAEFVLPEDSPAKQILDDNDLDWNDGNLILRRVLAKSGRSRSFVNDSPSSVQVLGQLAPYLIDIHSQHDTLLLKDKQFQLSILDSYAGNKELLSSCRSVWSSLESARSELSSAIAKLKAAESSSDYNSAIYDELCKASLKEGELETLEEEYRQLSNAEEIKSDLYQAGQLLAPDDDGMQSLSSVIREGEKILDRVSKYVPATSSLASRLESVRVEIEDIVSEVSSLESGITLSEERLSAVEDRMSLLYGLLKKHSCSEIQQLISLRDSLEMSENDTAALKEKIESIRKEILRLEKEYDSIASSLHERRVMAAPSFSAEVEESLRFLELEQSVFCAEITTHSDSATGRDAVTLLFSSTGSSPSDVAKVASGGELSRIMLCLKDLLARYSAMPSLVFDEIDTGVSGSVADKMGTMICRMGKNMQVFAITHLPQVAAKGNAHFLVSKSIEEETGRAVSTIDKISDNERVSEIARMLSGSVVTPEAIANAKALMKS